MKVRKWVLVTDGGHGGSRDCVAAVRALHAGGYQTAVTVSPGTSRGVPSRYSKRRIAVPNVADSGYVEAVKGELQSFPYLTVICASEASMRALRQSGLHLTHKAVLSEEARKAQINVPASRTYPTWDEACADSDSFTYPVVVKPAIRTFSATRVDSPSQLPALDVAGGDIVVQEWIEGQLHAVSGVMWKGRLVASTAEKWIRIWPSSCGLASAAMTTENDPALENKLVRLLGDYEGIFCAQFAGSQLIDLNLRIHSSHSLSVAAGANLISIYCDLLNGMLIPRTRARPGLFYRWLEGDIRHVAEAYRAGTLSPAAAARALMPRRAVSHSIESLRDPGPLLARLIHASGRIGMSQEQRRLEPRVNG